MDSDEAYIRSLEKYIKRARRMWRIIRFCTYWFPIVIAWQLLWGIYIYTLGRVPLVTLLCLAVNIYLYIAILKIKRKVTRRKAADDIRIIQYQSIIKAHRNKQAQLN